MVNFGIELEFDDLGKNLFYFEEKLRPIIEKHSDHEFIVSNYSTKIDKWCLKIDGSCGFELVTPKLEFTKANLEMVCKITEEFKKSLSKNQQKDLVTDRCGFHIHFELEQKDSNKYPVYFKVWHNIENALFSVLHQSRMNNSFVNKLTYLYSRLTNNEIDEQYYFPCDKFSAIHVVENDHIEVRYAKSTFDAENIRNWTTLVRAISEIAEYYTERYCFYSDHLPLNSSKNATELIDFLFSNKNNIKTAWVKRNLFDVIRWIGKMSEENYSERIVLAA